jgi:stress-induced morphogen
MNGDFSSENVQNILTVSTYFSIHQLRTKCESFLHELQTLSPSLTVNDLTDNILAQNNNEPIPPASASSRAEAISSDERATEATAAHQPAPFMTNECPSNSDITHLFDIIRTSHPPPTQPTQHNPLDSFLVPMQTIQLNGPENVRQTENLFSDNKFV